jgi:RNA polymerase sigma factor (sigma-70 family)
VFYVLKGRVKPVNSSETETYRLTHLSKQEFVAELYRRYGKKLYAYAIYSWKLDEDTAWELVYKALYKVIDSYRNYEFETEGKFASFIFRIFINYLRNHYRDAKKLAKPIPMAVIEQAGPSEAALSEAEPVHNDRLKALNAALDKMEDWQRMLLLMRSEGRPYSEIATYINKPEDQLKVYYQRLKEQISKKLHEQRA